MSLLHYPDYLGGVCDCTRIVTGHSNFIIEMKRKSFALHLLLHKHNLTCYTVGIYYVFEIIDVWDAVSTFINRHKLFLTRKFCFEQRVGQFIMDPLISYLHIKIRIISRSVPGLATDSPRCVKGHGWILASSMVVHFKVYVFKMTAGV